ncbi:MAG TPA: hypothetical protein VNZ64_09750 [Candidatus Acidoferrum sp.]|nr:hypothetical protein [Candidatus Acidoferrum sp.]
MLVEEIAPRIRRSVANSVPQVGADDVGELEAEGIALAAALLASAEARGKKVSAGNVNYYATRLLRQGRRSTGHSNTDVMSPGTQIAARSRVVSLNRSLATQTARTCAYTTSWQHAAQIPPRRQRSGWIGNHWLMHLMLPPGKSSCARSKARSYQPWCRS